MGQTTALQTQQDDAAGEKTHGAGDPGKDQGEHARESAVRVLEEMAGTAKLKLTTTRDRIDNCLRGIDARVAQMADDWLSFHDELANAENMASSVDLSLDEVNLQLGRHLKNPPKATVTALKPRG